MPHIVILWVNSDVRLWWSCWNFYKRSIAFTVVLPLMYAGNCFLQWKAHKELITPIYEKPEMGFAPTLPIKQEGSVYIVLQPEHIDTLTKMFLWERKTWADVFWSHYRPIRQWQDLPRDQVVQWIQEYHEIIKPSSFINGLSEHVGMKVAPVTILDLMLSYVTEKYTHYYTLPESASSGLKMLLRSLEKAAK